MRIVQTPIAKQELTAIASEQFGDLIKAVVDVKKKIMAIGGELHADEEALLLEQGSKQEDLWGVNIYPERDRGEWIEFDSMINVRPRQENRSRIVENPTLRELITEIVNLLIK